MSVAPNLNDRPRLRPLDGFAVEDKGQRLLVLRDPSGVAEHEVRLPPRYVAILQLCDGETSRDDICAAYARRYNQLLTREALDSFLAQLDQILLLDSDRFRQHSATLFAEFARSDARAPLNAGRSYPKDPERLREMLNGYFAPPHGPGKPKPGSAPLPKALIAPHVDFNRGGPAYAWAYRPLADATELPELIVVLGTDHAGVDHAFTLTAKHYDTPLGRVTTDVDLVRALAEKTADLKGGGKALFADEHHHRGEHSIEFQMVWLRHLLGERLDDIKTLPILCGSLSEYVLTNRQPSKDERVGGILRALALLVEGKRVLWIAGADLAHVGPRYGDEQPLSADDLKSLEKRDQQTLDKVAAGDAAGWMTEIAREDDRRRVCGLTPIYAMLEAARPGAGRLAVYAQCPAEEGTTRSVVSIASVIYP